jgi:hypothetical protein
MMLPNNILGQTKEDLEKIKVLKEIQLLDNQIRQGNTPSIIFASTIPIIGTIVGAFIVAFFAWRQEKNKIPTADQERIIQDIAIMWFYNRHLEILL